MEEKIQKQRRRNDLESHTEEKTDGVMIMFTILMIFLAVIIFIDPINAATFDNTKSFDNKIGNYGKYEIKDWFGLQKLQDVELKTNTDTCFWKYCSAEKEIIMYQDGILVDDIKFLENNEEVNINSYNFYIKDGNKKKKYNPGTKVKAGTYTLVLEGMINPNQIIDWQVLIGGKYWTEEWALWIGGDAPVSYWDFNEAAGSVLGNKVNVSYNGTLINMVDGDWVAGKLGNALEFSGTNEYINGIGRIPALEGTAANYTISLWIQSQDNSVTRTIFGYDDDNGANTDGIYLYQQSAPNVIIHTGDGATSINLGDIELINGQWHHLVLAKNSTHMGVWLNNTQIDSTAAAGLAPCVACKFNISGNFNLADYDGLLDEIGIWNRTLTTEEIGSLWNEGAGLAFGAGEGVILANPVNKTILSDGVIVFNTTLTSDAGFEFRNATISIWYNNGSLTNQTTKIITGISNLTNFSVSSINPEKYLWNVEACSNSSTTTTCVVATNNFTFTYGAVTNSISFENNVYETDNQTLTIDITIPSGLTPVNAVLNYNGTEYTPVVNNKGNNNYVLNKTFDIPGIDTANINRTFYFKWDLNTYTQLSANSSQNVSRIELGLCNSTMSVKYINYTFQDESNGTEIPATISQYNTNYWLGNGGVKKSLALTNSSEKDSFTYCFNPSFRSLQTSQGVGYNKDGYQQRINTYNESLSNSVINRTLLLLPTASGLFVTFQVINIAEQPISDVFVNVSRGNDLIGSGTTNDAGAITFFLNPDFSHDLVFISSGVDTFKTSLFPTQTSYTITLGEEATSTITEDYSKGVDFQIHPSNTTLTNDTSYDFKLITTSSFWEIERFGFNLRNSSGNIVASSSVSSNGGTATINYNVGNITSYIQMDYFWLIAGNYTNGTTSWYILSSSGTDWSISNFITDFTNYSDSGMFGLGDFGRGIIIFLVVFIFVGIMSYKFGLVSPAGVSSLAFGLVLFFDVGLDLFPPILDNTIPNFPTIFMGIIMLGILFKEVWR